MSHAPTAHPAHPGHAKAAGQPHTQPHVSNLTKAREDAVAIHKALTSGWFTDEKGVFNILCNRTQAQLVDIRRQYEGDGLKRDILDDIGANTHGHFEDLCSALVKRNEEYDAYRIHKAIDRLSTNEDQLIEILSHREVWEIKGINAEYVSAYKKTAQAALEKDLGGEFGLLMSLLADPTNERQVPTDEAHQIDLDVQALYEASQGKTIGHKAEPFIRVFGTRTKAYLKKVYNAYANKHGKTLEAIISGWPLGGSVAKALLAIITPPEEFYSNLLWNAMKGVGTNYSTCIRIIVTQRERYLPGIAEHFMHTHKKTLKLMVEEETSGDFKKAVALLLEFYASAK